MGVYGASVANNKPNSNQQLNLEEVDPADGSTGGSGEEEAAALPAQPVP